MVQQPQASWASTPRLCAKSLVLPTLMQLLITSSSCLLLSPADVDDIHANSQHPCAAYMYPAGGGTQHHPAASAPPSADGEAAAGRPTELPAGTAAWAEGAAPALGETEGDHSGHQPEVGAAMGESPGADPAAEAVVGAANPAPSGTAGAADEGAAAEAGAAAAAGEGGGGGAGAGGEMQAAAPAADQAYDASAYHAHAAGYDPYSASYASYWDPYGYHNYYYSGYAGM